MEISLYKNEITFELTDDDLNNFHFRKKYFENKENTYNFTDMLLNIFEKQSNISVPDEDYVIEITDHEDGCTIKVILKKSLVEDTAFKPHKSNKIVVYKTNSYNYFVDLLDVFKKNKCKCYLWNDDIFIVCNLSLIPLLIEYNFEKTSVKQCYLNEHAQLLKL